MCRGCDVLHSLDAQLHSTESKMISFANLKVTSASASQMRIWMAGGLSPSLWLSTTALHTTQLFKKTQHQLQHHKAEQNKGKPDPVKGQCAMMPVTLYKAHKTKRADSCGVTCNHYVSATLHSTSAPHIVQAYRQASPHCVLEELVQHVVKMCGDVWDGGLQVSCAGHLRSHTVCLSGHLSLHTTIAIVMLYLRLYSKSIDDSL